MSIEQPKDEKATNLVSTSVLEKPEVELSEDEQQDAHEKECSERFIQDCVMSSDLAPGQKVFVAGYVDSKPGAWREYKGKDFRVVESMVEGNVLKVSFGVYIDDYEAQRIDVEIPLTEKV